MGWHDTYLLPSGAQPCIAREERLGALPRRAFVSLGSALRIVRLRPPVALEGFVPAAQGVRAVAVLAGALFPAGAQPVVVDAVGHAWLTDGKVAPEALVAAAVGAVGELRCV